MKRISLFLFSLALLFACSACGDLSEQKEPLQEQTDNLTEEYQEPTQPEKDVAAPEKIVLEGQSVSWDEFPMPSAEVFSLTGEDAVVYNAITEVYNPKTYAETFIQSPDEIRDLSLPAFDIYEQVSNENGDTTYYGLFYKYDFYDLGSGLTDLNNPVYDLRCGKSPASITIDSEGNLIDFAETYESSNDPDGDIRRVCGPMSALADYFCGITDSYSKEPKGIPNLDAEEMVDQYLNYFFVGK